MYSLTDKRIHTCNSQHYQERTFSCPPQIPSYYVVVHYLLPASVSGKDQLDSCSYSFVVSRVSYHGITQHADSRNWLPSFCLMLLWFFYIYWMYQGFIPLHCWEVSIAWIHHRLFCRWCCNHLLRSYIIPTLRKGKLRLKEMKYPISLS